MQNDYFISLGEGGWRGEKVHKFTRCETLTVLMTPNSDGEARDVEEKTIAHSFQVFSLSVYFCNLVSVTPPPPDEAQTHVMVEKCVWGFTLCVHTDQHRHGQPLNFA